jgi:hypothetical protein
MKKLITFECLLIIFFALAWNLSKANTKGVNESWVEDICKRMSGEIYDNAYLLAKFHSDKTKEGLLAWEDYSSLMADNIAIYNYFDCERYDRFDD